MGATANTALETIFHGKSSISILINNKVYATIIFVAPTRFLKHQLESCQAYVDKATDSLTRLFSERRLTDQIEKLTHEHMQIQTVDPLGLTQLTDSISRSPRSFGEIRLSVETQTATLDGRELNLTKREFDLLNTFLQSAETALSRVQIISRVWVARSGISSNVLNLTVKTLRDKLEAAGEPRVIHSLRTYGYVLKE